MTQDQFPLSSFGSREGINKAVLAVSNRVTACADLQGSAACVCLLAPGRLRCISL